MSRTAERIRYVVAAERDRSTLGRPPNNHRESSPAVAKTLSGHIWHARRAERVVSVVLLFAT
jgi:hypothetical protein